MDGVFDTNMLLITGGTGFLAEELIKRLQGSKIRVVARNEGKLVALKEKYPSIDILTGDIADEWVAKKAMRGVNRVFHCAAYKHVGLAEKDVFQCINSNVTGTINLLRESFFTRPEFFVMISTDKAAQVAGVYGATKMLGEKLMQEAESINPETKYRVVRYGNVIYSTGSFLTKWKEKMAAGEEIVLTDPKATRFFFTREKAVDLIFDCVEKAENAKPWVPTMRAISMGDALKACQNVWGKKSPVRIIGLQEGENLNETMGGGIFSNEVEQYSVKDFEKFL